MKKLFLYAFAAFAIFALGSCSDEEGGGYTPPLDKYTGGFYVLNEGQYGQPASVNYYNGTSWALEVFQSNNDGEKLGMTGTVAVCDADNMYIVTKEKPFLVKVGLRDFKMKAQLADDAIESQARSFALIDRKSGVLTTDRGAYLVTLDPLSIADEPFVETRNLNGDVAVSGGYIFLLGDVNAGNVVMVYDASTLAHVKDLGAAKTGFASAGGALWAGCDDKLLKINVSQLTSEEVALPASLSIYYNPTYTPTGLKASMTGNAIYFVNALSAYTGRDVYKHTIATGETAKVFTAPTAENPKDATKPLTYSVYGAGVNVNPRTGDLYLVYTRDGWGENYLFTDIYVVGADGTQKSRIPYTSENETVYWYPSMLIFR